LDDACGSFCCKAASIFSPALELPLASSNDDDDDDDDDTDDVVDTDVEICWLELCRAASNMLPLSLGLSEKARDPAAGIAGENGIGTKAA
jgi:hypothetical protein